MENLRDIIDYVQKEQGVFRHLFILVLFVIPSCVIFQSTDGIGPYSPLVYTCVYLLLVTGILWQVVSIEQLLHRIATIERKMGENNREEKE